MNYQKMKALKRWVATLLALVLVFQFGISDLTALQAQKAYAAGTQGVSADATHALTNPSNKNLTFAIPEPLLEQGAEVGAKVAGVAAAAFTAVAAKLIGDHNAKSQPAQPSSTQKSNPSPQPPKSDLPSRIAQITAAASGIADKIKQYSYGTYAHMVDVIKTERLGLQAHHLIEKRFASILNIKDSNLMYSIALTPQQHQLFTNAWRTAIGYAGDLNKATTLTANREQVYEAALKIYKEFPIILQIINIAKNK